MERQAYRAMAETEGTHWWFVGRRKIIGSLIEQRIRPVKSARILEVGCGTGGNLRLLAEYGVVEAIEHDDDARTIARERSGIDVQSGHLPDGIDHVRGPFQLIALFDVLEHIDRDDESLRVLATVLAPGGNIILTVPALQFLWSSHDVAHHHQRRYSMRRLRAVLEQAGLRVEFISYFNSLLLPVAILQRLVSRFSGREPALDNIPGRPINFFLERIFSAERVLLKHMRLPVGLSLCAICSAK